MKGSVDAVLLFGDRHQKVGAYCRPHLAVNRITRPTKKVADTQVLFDPFEEQFNLPPVFVEIADEFRLYLEIIGQENKGTTLLNIATANAPLLVGTP